MKQELRRERTKRLLLDATEAVIREKGCAKTTLNDIMERSGLSKGGIFHYVKSKDELFSLVLQERFEETNRRFFKATVEEEDKFAGPLGEIIARLPELEDPDDVGNQVFMYLLGRSDQPEVRNVLQKFYEQAFYISKRWILAGQEAGVIPLSVDAEKTADLFVLISFGLRMRSAVSVDRFAHRFAFGSDDFAALMANMLQPERWGKGGHDG